MYIIVLQRYTKFALCGSSLLKTIYYPQERKNFKTGKATTFTPINHATSQQRVSGITIPFVPFHIPI
jgi:hypothetical protein